MALATTSIAYRDGRCALCDRTTEGSSAPWEVRLHIFSPARTVTLRCWLCTACQPTPATVSVTSTDLLERLLGWYRSTPSVWPTLRRVAETPSGAAVDQEADRLFGRLLVRLGLGDVTCTGCVRALLPPPFNWESYTYTSTGGQSWTWDVACARTLVARRPALERLALEPADVAASLAGHGHVEEDHLAHIPPDRLYEPVLLAPVPDGQGHVLIDGSHRATLRIREGLAVHAFLLSPVESALAVEVVPLAMQRIAQELHRQGLLPRDLRH